MTRRRQSSNSPYYGPRMPIKEQSKPDNNDGETFTAVCDPVHRAGPHVFLGSSNRGLLWTSEQRRTLCILVFWLKKPWDELAEVHNNLFEACFPMSNGLHRRRTSTALKAQWNEMRTEKHPIWTEICGTKDFRAISVKYAKLLEDIKLACKPGKHPSREEESGRDKLNHRCRGEDQSLKDWSEIDHRSLQDGSGINDQSLQDSTKVEEDPLLQESLEIEEANPLKLPDTKISDKEKTNPPVLLFRAYGPCSRGTNGGRNGFRSGRFRSIHVNRVLPPEGEYLLEYAKTHLDLCSRIDSPFVSTTSSLSWALKKAFELGTDSRIAVIDLRSCDRSTRVYYAMPIVQILRQRHVKAVQRYLGSVEYLVWSEISPTSILGEFSLTQILEIDGVFPAASGMLKLERARRSMMPLMQRLVQPPIPPTPAYDDSMIAELIGRMIPIIFPNLDHLHTDAYALIQVILANWNFILDSTSWAEDTNWMKIVKRYAISHNRRDATSTFSHVNVAPSDVSNSTLSSPSQLLASPGSNASLSSLSVLSGIEEYLCVESPCDRLFKFR